jgi:GNAT superfamily N-acetyltransferase
MIHSLYNSLCIMSVSIEIRAIALDQWLPDRCLTFSGPVEPASLEGQGGCPSLSGPYTNGDRRSLVALYREALDTFDCCGFVAWEGEAVVAYNNFFPGDMATRIKFYGWGGRERSAPGTLVHNCLSMVRGPAYHRQGIGSALIRRSLDWAGAAGWRRFEVYNVLPDAEIAYENDQKSCLTFWQKLGFELVSTTAAPTAVQQAYGLSHLYTMAVDLSTA